MSASRFPVSDGPLRHLIISREFPPAAYPPGGIGTYTAHIARLLAAAGETVHVIGERWSGAPLERQELCDGRLVIHRIRLNQPLSVPRSALVRESVQLELQLLGAASSPTQRFSWLAALLAESLVQGEGIDLIEAQEWEAPLYYFLLRRALGLGPDRQPPCVVHLHSPTEFIYRHNEWTAGSPEYLPIVRLEEYCIGAADALICPSHYLAQQIAARYAIPTAEIGVIPYPIGDSTFVPRKASAWRGGGIVYVGRLEPRKGLIEFVEAAVEVASTDDSARFDFVGDDVWYRGGLTVQRYMKSRIPRALRSRFRFHGVQPRARLPGLLAGARAAVIPSRWENFPNTCIEAMSSGLPVIASPTGGMVEMVEDGVTGWIAPSQSPEGLADALRRALATPAEQCEAMGRAAAEAIRGQCGNEVTTRRHLSKRAEIVRLGVTNSARLSASLGRGAAPTTVSCGDGNRHGLAIVVDALEGGNSSKAVDSIRSLRVPPRAVTVVRRASNGRGRDEARGGAERGWTYMEADDASHVHALSVALQTLVERHHVAGVALVPASAVLTPSFVQACTAALERHPEIGIVSCWMDHAAGGFMRPCPSFPYQWIADDVAQVAVIRADAFIASGGLRETLPPRYARWDLGNTILAAGWKAITYPAVLATGGEAATAASQATPDTDRLHQILRDRLPGQFSRDAAVLASWLAPTAFGPGLGVSDMLRLPLGTQVSLAVDAVRHPQRALGWLRTRWTRIRG